MFVGWFLFFWCFCQVSNSSMSPALKSWGSPACISRTYFAFSFGWYVFHVLGLSVIGGMFFLICVIFFCLSM